MNKFNGIIVSWFILLNALFSGQGGYTQLWDKLIAHLRRHLGLALYKWSESINQSIKKGINK